MSTGDDAAGHRQGPASRIVRIAGWAAPVCAGLVVFATVWLAVPHEAWLPVPPPVPLADAWQQPIERTTAWLVDAHVAALRRLPGDVAAAAVIASAVWSALTAVVLARTLRFASLGVPAAALLALAAASAPLFAWQAGSPLGGGPLSLFAAMWLWATTRRTDSRFAARVSSSPRKRWLVVAIMVVAVALALGLGDGREAVARIRGDLGPIGLLLALVSLSGVIDDDSARRRRMWMGAAVIFGVAAPLPPHLHAAVVLPWTWGIAGDGLARLVRWRGRGAGRWAMAGLVAWIALHAGRVPWGQQRQHAALVRTWADGVTALVDAGHPLVEDRSTSGRLVAALIRANAGRPAGPRLMSPLDAYAAAGRGRSPIVVDASVRDRLQWSGLGLDAVDPNDGGVPLTRLLDALPRGTIVLAAISRDAAATLTPVDWQALGGIGLRSPDAGLARGHLVAGVTRARVEGLEAAGTDALRLSVQPGDPIGRTGHRSPIDARLEADGTQVRLFLRDRPILDQPGLVLAFFTTRGDLLGWRGGRTAAHLDGPPLGDGPVIRHEAVAALPCVDVGATPIALDAVSGTGTLGLTWPGGPATMDLRTPGGPLTVAPRLVDVGAEETATLVTTGPGAAGVTIASDGRPLGATLRQDGPVAATATPLARVCAAWPLPYRFDLDDGVLELPLLPRFEPLYGAGWHDLEVGTGGYFRWMSGRAADFRLPLRAARASRVVLDAQGVRPPRPGDVVRLLVNGQPAGEFPVYGTRGLYTWEVPAASWRAGINLLRLETTATVRPADLQRGGDPRRLGMLVYGWRLEASDSLSQR